MTTTLLNLPSPLDLTTTEPNNLETPLDLTTTEPDNLETPTDLTTTEPISLSLASSSDLPATIPLDQSIFDVVPVQNLAVVVSNIDPVEIKPTTASILFSPVIKPYTPDSLTGGVSGALTDPIYRFYNATSKGHFFTADSAERDNVLAHSEWGYTYEGVGFKASTTLNNNFNLLPLFRFYNDTSKGHFFTANIEEAINVYNHTDWGYTFEGIGFYAYGADANLGSDVYRFYNSASCGHFFTIDPAERDNVLAHPEWGYTYEGVAFEAMQ